MKTAVETSMITSRSPSDSLIAVCPWPTELRSFVALRHEAWGGALLRVA
jgi:hypothetical protein